MSGLPPPSPEQLRVMELLRRGGHVAVEAVAGAGKTTCVLHVAADRAPGRVLLVTYSSRLRAETRERAAAAGLTNLAVHTYHSLAVAHYCRRAHTDEGMRAALRGARPPARPPEAFDLVVVDEAQDMSALYMELVLAAAADSGGAPPQLCVLGDRLQNIFPFMGADERHLTLAPAAFGFFGGRAWEHATLRDTYRCSPRLCDFINRVVLGHGLLRPGRPQSDAGRGARYLRCDPYGAELLAAVSELLRRHGNENVFILAPSVRACAAPGRETPSVKLCNGLSARGVPVFSPVGDEERLDRDVMRGKAVFCTYHQSKGLERDAVVLLGADAGYMRYFARGEPPDRCPNAMYVAMTRAKEELLLVHGQREAALPFLDLDELRAGRDEGRWEALGLGGAGGEGEGGSRPTRRSVLDLLRHLPSAALEAAAARLTVARRRPPAAAVIAVPQKATQAGSGLVESFGEITGVAVPAAFEHVLRGDTTVRVATADARFPLPFAPGAPPPAARLLLLSTLYCAAQSGFDFKKTQIEEHDWMSDAELARCVERLREAVASECGGAAAELPERPEFERPLAAGPTPTRPRPELGGRALAGVADLVTDGAIFEIKCTGALTSEHALQLALYGYLERETRDDAADLLREAAAPGASLRGVARMMGVRPSEAHAERLAEEAARPPRRLLLYNVFTDEMLEVVADRDALRAAVGAAVAAKDAVTARQTDAEFLAEAAATAVRAGGGRGEEEEEGAMAEVTVDARETALAECLGSDARTVGLPLGDACVTSGERRTVIERKSATDLGASIRDGRWREQLRRMAAVADGTVFLVAVEGLGEGEREAGGALFGGVPEASLRSALLSAQLRDGVHVAHTRDVRGTAELVRAVARKMAKGGGGGPGMESAVHVARAALPRRGAGWDRRALAEAQLSLAPGVSGAIAAALLDAGGHETLAAWAEAAAAAGPKALADTAVTGAGRRLGDKTAAKLVALML